MEVKGLSAYLGGLSSNWTLSGKSSHPYIGTSNLSQVSMSGDRRIVEGCCLPTFLAQRHKQNGDLP